jgi:deazaflavin-dependent oxidoreductase (nitroreductase family)
MQTVQADYFIAYHNLKLTRDANGVLIAEFHINLRAFHYVRASLSEATNGVEGGTFKGKPVIVLTFKGAKSGRIRKTPLMRIEHNGIYAVVASNSGAPVHPFWYRDIVANPLVELQDGRVKHEMRTREIFGEEKNRTVEAGGRRLFGIPRLPSRSRSRNPGARPEALRA